MEHAVATCKLEPISALVWQQRKTMETFCTALQFALFSLPLARDEAQLQSLPMNSFHQCPLVACIPDLGATLSRRILNNSVSVL